MYLREVLQQVDLSMITITPYGAAGEVTGSAYLVETENANILVDFGMFQGDKDDDARNVVPGKIHRTKIDAMILTHGHLDHCGRIPILVREGYRGPIRATAATKEMAGIILRDAAHIQESDFERRTRRAKKHGHKISRTDTPLFDSDDVQRALNQFREVEYNDSVHIADGITAIFRDAGHMLGSASVELKIEGKTIVFSGDVGPPGLPYLRDAESPLHADVVVMESTYGDRDHRSLQETEDEFEQILRQAISTNGKIFIPSFAIGRAQQMMYYLAELIREKHIPPIPIFLDSPMAIIATQAYAKYDELFDVESTALMENDQLKRDLSSLRFCETADESRAINDAKPPFVVIAGAGMMNAGRIMHHTRHNISDPNSHIVIVGYQSRGSLGRRLVDGADHISIMGDYKPVNAQIHTLGGFSAHAGQTDLLKWFAPMAQSKPKVFLTHGEDDARTVLQKKLNEQFGVEAQLPVYAEHIQIED